jgi:hypothetical protein
VSGARERDLPLVRERNLPFVLVNRIPAQIMSFAT